MDRKKQQGGSLYSYYLQDITKKDLLNVEQERHYLALSQKGDQAARDVMITSNLQLVVKVAREYTKRTLSHHTFLDLIAEGNVGLMKAVDKFDLSKECRFSTYAVWWIRESIESAIMNRDRLVRLPIHRIKEVHRLWRQTHEMESRLNHSPSLKDIANNTGLTPIHVDNLVQLSGCIAVKASVDVEPSHHKSLETCRSEHIPEPVSVYDNARLMSALEKTVLSLPKRHQDILISRYGLFGQEVKKLQCLGEQFGMSKERVRQIQLEGIEKLQSKLEFDGWGD